MLTNTIVLLSVFHLWAFAQSPLLVSTPPSLIALSDSCLQIPCNFTVTGGLDGPIRGVWIITDVRFELYPEYVIFNGSHKKYPMEFNGDLNKGNCRTLFTDLKKSYSNHYFFRIETAAFKASARFQPLRIRVKDSLSPEINVSGTTMENNMVTITCSALTPCPQAPPTLTWNLQQKPTIIRELATDGTFCSKIIETITLQDQHDGLTIHCNASYPVDNGDRMKLSDSHQTLHVLYAPKNTTAVVSPSAVVSAGTFVNLSCSSRANPRVDLFTWFWVSSGGTVNVSVGHLFRLNVTEGGEYYCEARNRLGTERSERITLTVPGTFKVSLLWSIIIAGSVALVLLMCLVMYFCWLKSAERLKKTEKDQVDGESKATEDIHYGEIHFSKGTPEAATVYGEETETIYSQIKVSSAAGPGEEQAKVESS